MDDSVRNKDFMSKFFAGKAIIQTLDARDSIDLSKYCSERGFHSHVDDETIIDHFTGYGKHIIFFSISLKDNMVSLRSSYFGNIDTPLAKYDSDIFNTPTFKL